MSRGSLLLLLLALCAATALAQDPRELERTCTFYNPEETVVSLTAVAGNDVVYETIDWGLRPTLLTYSVHADKPVDVLVLDWSQFQAYQHGTPPVVFQDYSFYGVKDASVSSGRIHREGEESLVLMVRASADASGTRNAGNATTLVSMTIDAVLDHYKLDYLVVVAVLGVAVGAILIFLLVAQAFRKLHEYTRRSVTFNSAGARGLDKAKADMYGMFRANTYEEDLIVEEFMPSISKATLLARMAPIFLATGILLVFALPRTDRSSVNVVVIPVSSLMVMNIAAVAIVLQQQALAVLYYSWLRYHVVIDFQNRNVWRNPGWVLSVLCGIVMTVDMFVWPYDLSQAELVLVTRLNSTHLLNTSLLLLLLFRLYNYESEMVSLNRLVEHHEVRTRGTSAKLTNSWEVLVITELDFKKYVSDRQEMVRRFRKTQPDKIALQLRALPFPQSRDDLEHWLFATPDTAAARRAEINQMREPFRFNAWWALKAMQSLGHYVPIWTSMAHIEVDPNIAAQAERARADKKAAETAARAVLKPALKVTRAPAPAPAPASAAPARKRSSSSKKRDAASASEASASTPLLSGSDAPAPVS